MTHDYSVKWRRNLCFYHLKHRNFLLSGTLFISGLFQDEENFYAIRRYFLLLAYHGYSNTTRQRRRSGAASAKTRHHSSREQERDDRRGRRPKALFKLLYEYGNTIFIYFFALKKMTEAKLCIIMIITSFIRTIMIIDVFASGTNFTEVWNTSL